MELLDLSGNKFGDEGAFAFTKCLDKVSRLVMENCAVTMNGFVRFKQAYEIFSKKVLDSKHAKTNFPYFFTNENG